MPVSGHASTSYGAPAYSSAVQKQPTISSINKLERHLVKASSSLGGDLNGLVDLMDMLKDGAYGGDSTSQIQIAAVQALHTVFASLIRQGRLIGKVKELQGNTAASQALKAVREWIKLQWDLYLDRLCSMLSHEDAALAVASLAALMSLLRVTSRQLSSLQSPPTYTFDATLWRRIMQHLLVPAANGRQTVASAVQTEFADNYLNIYDDIRYYFLHNVQKFTTAQSLTDVSRTSLLFFLESLTSMATSEDQLNEFWAGRPSMQALTIPKPSKMPSKKRKRPVTEDGSTGIFDDTDSASSGDEDTTKGAQADQRRGGQHDLLSLQAHRRAFSAAWISFLRLNLSEDDIKRILVMLHRQVMPHLIDPSVLIDFLADNCDYGGTVALLALNGLFSLISRHGLDYPDFFLKLYSLLDSQVLHVRYRPRFLRMLDTFLRSTGLSVALVASFIKRLTRLTLSAPPTATVAIIPFIYNLLKRHPSCMVLIHSSEQVELGTVFTDPFKATERDPLQTMAIESSLWEVNAMRYHYSPSVSTLARIFQEAFTKPSYDLEDFLDHTYSTMFETEANRKVKKAPAMNGMPPISELSYLFPPPVVAHGDAQEAALHMEGKGDIVSRLWRFS